MKTRLRVTGVYRRTEKSMERVLGLNQSLVDSFTRQQTTPEPSAEHSLVKSDTASPSKPAAGQYTCIPQIHMAKPKSNLPISSCCRTPFLHSLVY